MASLKATVVKIGELLRAKGEIKAEEGKGVKTKQSMPLGRVSFTDLRGS